MSLQLVRDAPRPPQPRREERYLALHLPAFRLESCGYTASAPVALIGEQKNAVRLLALTPAATDLGLRPGMTASEARALFPEVLLEPWDASSELECRTALVTAFQRIVERVSWLWDDVLALEIGAVAHLEGGEPGMIERVLALAHACGHTCTLAVTDHPVAAAALATSSSDVQCVEVGEVAAALADRPLWAMRMPATILDRLHTVGIRTLGAFAALDPAAVARRFGAEGATLHRIARGAALSRRATWVPPEDDQEIAHHVILAEPTSVLQPVLFVLGGVFRTFAAQLSLIDEAAVALRLRLVLDWGVFLAPVFVRLGRPTRDPEVMMRVVTSCLEQVQLRAPLVEVMVDVAERVQATGWQNELTSRRHAVEPLPDLLARLSNTLGNEAVFQVQVADTWEPECAWSAVPIEPTLLAPKPRRSSRPDPIEGRSDASLRDDDDDPVIALQAWEEGRLVEQVAPPRPSLILEHRVPIAVDLVGERPVRVRLDAGWRGVHRAAGPEHLSGGWWRRDGGFDRIYWVVDLGGDLAWIFCERDVWYLHGWFD